MPRAQWTLSTRCFYKDGVYQFHISRELQNGTKGMYPAECDDFCKQLLIALNAMEEIKNVK
jgi:hypothetical protein